MAEQHTGTIQDPIPQELIWKDKQGKFYKVAGTGGSSSSSGEDPRVGNLDALTTSDKHTVVAAINEVNAKQGAVDATDTVKGIVTLTDDVLDKTSAKTGGKAASPLAVNKVYIRMGAISDLTTTDKTTVVRAVNELHTKQGNLDALTTTAKDNLVNAINEIAVKTSNQYIATPLFISPMNNQSGVSVLTMFAMTPFKSLDESETLNYRQIQIDTNPQFNSDELSQGTVDSGRETNVTLDLINLERLKPHTTYYMRAQDITVSGAKSAPSTIEFTTGDNLSLKPPTVTLKGYNNSPDDIGSGLTIEWSQAEVFDPINPDSSVFQGRHKNTDVVITLANNSRSEIWSVKDTGDFSAIVPAGTLQKGTKYRVTVTAKGGDNMSPTNDYGQGVTVKEFTTSSDFGTVQPPVVTITGGNTNVSETPTISGGVFSNTREPDTHAATEIKVLLSENMRPVWEHTENSAVTSLVVPKGKLQSGKQYKVQLRYKGTNFGWSAWGETTFTTTTSFIKYNYIGIPGTSTFGVGLAEEKDYKAVQLEPAEKCLDPTDFQYGLYGYNTDRSNNSVGVVAMKWIPKFYIKQLQKNEGTVNLNDSELEALLPYVEVTKEQMKEAQRRSPHNALVVAPADKFTNEADANAHGFYLMRGFIDGGKEYNGFFIANTITTWYEEMRSNKLHMGYGELNQRHDEYLLRASTNLIHPEGAAWPNTVSAINAKVNFVQTLSGSKWQCCSIYAWAVISILSLIQGQYATDTSECAWYDSTLVTNFPKGINSSGTKDINDSTVTTTPIVNDNQGSVFVTKDAYTKTTHNGSIIGITNVNGWLYQYLIGSWGDGSKMLKRSASIYDITYDNVDTSSASYYETKNVSRISSEWGDTKSSLPDLAGDDKDFFGIYAFGGNTSRNSNEFGMDYHDPSPSYSAVRVGGYWKGGDSAGVFCRVGNDWTSSGSDYGFHAMAYPRESVRVTANAPERTPSMQSILVEKGTTLGEAKKKLVTPTADKYEFKEWQC